MIGFYERLVSKFYNAEKEQFSLALASYKANCYSINKKVYKIILVLDGEIDVLYNSKIRNLKRDQIIIINPNKVFAINVKENENLVLILDLEYDFVARRNDNVLSFSFDIKNFEGNEKVQRIVHLIKNFFCIYTVDVNVSVQKCMFSLNEIITLLCDYFLEISDEEYKINRMTRQKLVNIMENLFETSNDYTLDDVANELNLRSSNTSKLFKPLFGYGFSECHRFSKINRAIELLYFSDNNISEITSAIGFLNLKSLNENFQRYVGVSPSKYRKKMKFSGSNCRYNNIGNILKSDNILKIYKDYEQENIFLDNIVKTEYIKTFDVDVNNNCMQFQNVVGQIADISMFGDNWMECIKDIGARLKYKNLKMDLFFDDESMYLIKNEKEKELLDNNKRERITQWIESMSIACRIVIEIPIECADNIYNYIYKNKKIKNAYSVLEDFFEHITMLVPFFYLKHWSFELKMPWSWTSAKNSKEYEKYKYVYSCIYKLLKRNFYESNIGVALGDVSIIKSDKNLKNMKDIVVDEFKPQFFSFEIVDERLFSKEIDLANTQMRILDNAKKVISFIRRLEKKYSFKSDIYVSRILMSFDCKNIPKIYWESIGALNLINRFLIAQKENVLIASIFYYDDIYKSKKELYANVDKYVQKKKLNNDLGIKNTSYYVSEIIENMGHRCIFLRDGLIATYIGGNKYDFLIYQDLSICKDFVMASKKMTNRVFLNKKHKIKIKGLKGKYKIVTKILHATTNTFYYEWEKMGAPAHIGKEDKEYIQMKAIPERHVEIVDIYNVFERTIELDLFEIAHIEITKIYDSK